MDVVSSPSSRTLGPAVGRPLWPIGPDLLLHRSASVLLSLLIVMVGAILTLTTFVNLNRREATALDRALAHRAESIETAMRDRMLTYEAVLHSAAGLVHASEAVTGGEWRAFVEQLRLAASYPGLQGIGYAPRLPKGAPVPDTDSDLASFGDDLALDPERDRTAILFLEPQNERNRRVLGFDMMREPTRRRVMERARDSGFAALTPKIMLLQSSGAASEPGFLMYFPVFTRGAPPDDVPERRARLVGYVYAPFQAETFIDSVLGDQPDELTVEVLDASVTDSDASLYRHGDVAASGFLHETLLSMLGHEWLIRVGALPSFVDERRSSDPTWTLVAGVTTTLLVAALVFTLALARQNLANRLKAELLLHERDRYAAAILDNSLDAYVAIDERDRIVEWNRQAETTFGWTRSAALGRRLADTLVPERYREQHLSALRTYSERTPKLVGRRIEMPALRSDGTEFTVELSIIAAPAKDGRSFVASMRDVTESRQQQAEILKMNVTLEQRIAERTEALAAANLSLHSVNEQLEAFAQNVSHDLRAPLRAIHGYTGIVLTECSSLDPASRTHLSKVQRSVERMQLIIEDLLRLALVRQQPMQKERFDLWSLIMHVVGEVGGANPPRIQATPDDLGEVLADRGLIEQALRNLVSNAVKFTAPVAEPKITFGSEVTGGERVYFIKDNGVGFDACYAHKLFRVFQRLHPGERFEGTGLGLTIVKTIIERHGGRVWASSAPGEGATFCFTLP